MLSPEKLSLSERARQKVREALTESDNPNDSFLRFRLDVGVPPSGYGLWLGIDDSFDAARDYRLSLGDIDLVLDSESLNIVQTSVLSYEIDYQEGPEGRGFLINIKQP